MKRLKRIAAALLLISICFACISTRAYAADGKISFTDLNTTVGETFTVRCKINSDDGKIGNVTLKISYDTSYVQFMSGDGVTEATAGQLEYQGTGDSDELQFEMQFQALQEGQTKTELDDGNVEVLTEDGEIINCTLGYFEVTIGEGDPSKIENLTTGPEVEVDGVQYTLSENFSDVEVPNGFSTGTITYDGESYQGAVFDNGDMKLGYLVDSDDTGEFYIYDESNSVFSPFEYVTFSDSYIIFLQDDDSLSIPSRYIKHTLNYNGHEFSAWQDSENPDYHLIYALNQDGEKLIYRYDEADKTFQRFLIEDTGTDNSTEKESSSGLFGNISDYLKNHIDQFLIGAGMLLVLELLFIIILGVKLHNRNTELDEVYDQLDEFTEPKVKANSGSRLPKSKAIERPPAEQREEEDYYEEDDYEDDIFDEDDEYEDMEELRFQNILSEETKSKKGGGRSEAYDEYENLDLDQTGDVSVNKKANKKKKKDKDDFDIEIIDL